VKFKESIPPQSGILRILRIQTLERKEYRKKWKVQSLAIE